ncbi:MAG: ABC transporter permease [Gemmatimonadota bacterium]
MFNRLDWYVARRYLGARRKGRFLSLITWIALGGVTLGVTALVVVLAVMNGAQRDLRDVILGSTPHVMVLQHGSALRMDRWRTVVDSVGTLPGVRAASPFVITQVGIGRAGYAQPADLYGISLDTEGRAVSDLERRLSGPELLGAPRTGTLPRVVLGERLANRMDLFPGDTVQVIALENTRMGPLGDLVPRVRLFEVQGTVRTGVYDYDLRNAYTDLEAVQGLLDLVADDQVSGVSVQVDDPFAADAVADAVGEKLGFPYFAQSWITQNSSLFSALKLEKLAMALILFLIVVVAAFNIVSTLVMVVADRTREIGILKSMGMTDQGILRIFLLQGVWIGVIGTVVGAGAGVVLALLLKRFPIITLPADVYTLDRLPVALDPWDVALTVGGSILISLLATIYPSLQASRLQPVEAIRHE